MKIYNNSEVFQNNSSEIKIGFLNINGLVDAYHAGYLNSDRNLLNLDLLVLAETKGPVIKTLGGGPVFFRISENKIFRPPLDARTKNRDPPLNLLENNYAPILGRHFALQLK